MMRMGFNTAGTEEVFERILREQIDRSLKTSDLFVYLEVGIAEGATLFAVAECLKAAAAIHRDFAWNAIGLDLYSGPFFNPYRFLGHCQHHNVEIFYNGHRRENQSFVVRDALDIITVALMPNGETVADQKFPSESIDFCLIDGCHGAPCVERDFLAIEQAIKVGGIVAFHDAMPEDQGGTLNNHGWQPHCQSGIAVIEALKKLNLATVLGFCIAGKDQWRAGWKFANLVAGDKSKGGNGFVFFRKVAA